MGHPHDEKEELPRGEVVALAQSLPSFARPDGRGRPSLREFRGHRGFMRSLLGTPWLFFRGSLLGVLLVALAGVGFGFVAGCEDRRIAVMAVAGGIVDGQVCGVFGYGLLEFVGLGSRGWRYGAGRNFYSAERIVGAENLQS